MNKIKDVLNYLTSLYPLEHGANFDQGKIGLQFGSLEDVVKKAIVCLDVTNKVIDEAIETGANLIISHHPFMFSPLLNLNYDSNFGLKLLKIIQNRINIMAFHTNYDVGYDGMNDVLARKLGLSNIKYTTIQIDNTSLIRLGECEKTSLKDYCEVVKKCFEQKTIKVAGNLNKTISKVAVVGGSGSSEFYEALKTDADVLVTGQLPHHLGIEAIENGFALIEVSHAVEFYGVEDLYEKLKNKFKEIKFGLYNKEYDPFIIL